MDITEYKYNDTLGHLTLNGQLDALVFGRDYAYKQRDQLGLTLSVYQDYRNTSKNQDEKETLQVIIDEICDKWYQYDNAIKIISNLIRDRAALRRQINICKNNKVATIKN